MKYLIILALAIGSVSLFNSQEKRDIFPFGSCITKSREKSPSPKEILFIISKTEKNFVYLSLNKSNLLEEIFKFNEEDYLVNSYSKELLYKEWLKIECPKEFNKNDVVQYIQHSALTEKNKELFLNNILK